ncbi:MAG TPA: hypothetical protein DDW76_22595 [Cyanobacteria bacterium UBA11369]|nr:hypothetical protein [Cyanobacteria bacterium UBA11371]HBE34938.1 hypothetical protein [Cyanobacteria bacterium UBA11368]HBE51489.1 hypothetical protein [Cyanobacteria bacterium UBA11369]
MNQKIEEIIARFGQEGWSVQKTKESFWVLRPKGVFNYKILLLTYNPFDDKFTIVKPPTPNDPHYQQAVKILEAIATKPYCLKDAIAPQNNSVNSFNIRGNMAMIFQIYGDTFLNFDDIRQVKATINRSECKVTFWWRNGESSNTFHDKQAKRVIQLVQLQALANFKQLQLDDGED